MLHLIQKTFRKILFGLCSHHVITDTHSLVNLVALHVWTQGWRCTRTGDYKRPNGLHMVALEKYFHHLPHSYTYIAHLQVKLSTIIAATTYLLCLFHLLFTIFLNQFLPTSFWNLNLPSLYLLLYAIVMVISVNTLPNLIMLISLTKSDFNYTSLQTMPLQGMKVKLAYLCILWF